MLKNKINLTKLSVSSIVITMLCHSFCCILPIFGWVVGLNVIGAVMHQYEPIYIGLNIISIIVGFYVTYYHKKKKNCDHTHCHKINARGYWIATIISLGLIIIPHLIE